MAEREKIMEQIKPNEISEKTFSKVLRGYNPAEVDEHIRRITENYAALYHENIALTRRLAEAEEKIAALSEKPAEVAPPAESEEARLLLEEAYRRANGILTSAKEGCDSILRNFRDKIEAQKKALSDITDTVSAFKNELFEKYRLHIELIEQLSPIYEYEEDLSPDEYVAHVVSEMKQSATSQQPAVKETAPAPGDDAPTVEMTTAKSDLQTLSEAAKEMALQAEKAKKKKDAVPSVSDLLASDGEAATEVRPAVSTASERSPS